jgi:hypothetical protein
MNGNAVTCDTNSKARTSCGHVLGRVPDDIRVEVERGLAVTAETVADLRSLSEFATGFDPRHQQ